MICFLGIGSNIDDRLSNLNQSIALISDDLHINFLQVSSFYESPPMYNLNLNIFFVTSLFNPCSFCYHTLMSGVDPRTMQKRDERIIRRLTAMRREMALRQTSEKAGEVPAFVSDAA